MSIDYSDEPGWPAEPTRVVVTPGRQEACWSSLLWREREQARRRERYRAARLAGASVQEAKRAASRAA